MPIKNNIISRVIRFSILLVFILVIYKILMRYFSMKENFLTSGEYPIAVDKPILYDSYNVAEHPGADAQGAAQIYVDYPIFPATSLENNAFINTYEELADEELVDVEESLDNTNEVLDNTNEVLDY